MASCSQRGRSTPLTMMIASMYQTIGVYKMDRPWCPRAKSVICQPSPSDHKARCVYHQHSFPARIQTRCIAQEPRVMTIDSIRAKPSLASKQHRPSFLSPLNPPTNNAGIVARRTAAAGGTGTSRPRQNGKSPAAVGLQHSVNTYLPTWSGALWRRGGPSGQAWILEFNTLGSVKATSADRKSFEPNYCCGMNVALPPTSMQ